MKEFFDKIFTFADEIRADDGRLFRGFVQPLSVTSPDNEGQYAVPGLTDERRYLLIASLSAFSGFDRPKQICFGGKTYTLLRLEEIAGSHWEGVLRLKGGGGDA